MTSPFSVTVPIPCTFPPRPQLSTYTGDSRITGRQTARLVPAPREPNNPLPVSTVTRAVELYDSATLPDLPDRAIRRARMPSYFMLAHRRPMGFFIDDGKRRRRRKDSRGHGG